MREREKTCPKSFGNLAEEIFFFVFLHETDFGNETGFFLPLVQKLAQGF